MDTFAAIDFETANSERSSVCSVGIVIVRDGKISRTFYSLIRPEPDYYSRWCTAVHGLTRADTDRANPFPDVWSRIAPDLEGLTLVAHNKAFDESCLKAVFRTYGMPYPDYTFLCTLVAARQRLPELENHKLDTVARAIGFDIKRHHHALADAEACAAIAQKLL